MNAADFQRNVLHQLETIAAEQRALRDGFDRLRTLLVEPASALQQHGAVKRKDAARLLGISLRKLELLIVAGRLRTAEDVRLIPMSEIRRYCSPALPLRRRSRAGYRVNTRRIADGQSDEAIEEARRAMRRRVNIDGQSDEALASLKRRLRAKGRQ